jgi:hypothetical protein
MNGLLMGIVIQQLNRCVSVVDQNAPSSNFRSDHFTLCVSSHSMNPKCATIQKMLRLQSSYCASLPPEILSKTQSMQGAVRMMGYPPPDTTEQLHAYDLQLILRSTHSFLAHHSSYIRNGRSLRILDFALLNAIADLQNLDATTSEDNHDPFLRRPS